MEGAAPLLAARGEEEVVEGRRRGGGGGATSAQTLGNVVVSIVGTGVLGLPYAFRTAGWVAGSLGVAAAGCATLYCMLLLVSCLTTTTTTTTTTTSVDFFPFLLDSVCLCLLIESFSLFFFGWGREMVLCCNQSKTLELKV